MSAYGKVVLDDTFYTRCWKNHGDIPLARSDKYYYMVLSTRASASRELFGVLFTAFLIFLIFF